MINKEIKDFKELELEKERREINNFIWNANFNCENVENLVELIGIILGDGHLHHRSQKSYRDYQLSVSLNLIDDP